MTVKELAVLLSKIDDIQGMTPAIFGQISFILITYLNQTQAKN